MGALDASQTDCEVEDTEAEACLRTFSRDDHLLLIKLVKAAQSQGATGKFGTWKEFLENTTQTAKLHDPARHEWKVLADFLNSFVDPAGIEKVEGQIRWHEHQQQEEALTRAAHGHRLKAEQTLAKDSAWRLVHATADHPGFSDCYTLPSYEKGWVRARPRAYQYAAEPVLLALDCEMVEGEKDPKELVRLSVVDASGRAVLEELVKPKKRVKDYRTSVTGITAEDLKGVSFTRKQAQMAVQGLLAGGRAVLVGHALHHDLRSLRLDYRPVIDTSLLITYRGLPTCAAGLADLSQRVLGRVLREEGAAHDCTRDAATAMDLVHHVLSAGGSIPPLDPPEVKVPKEELRKLLAHSLPADFGDADLRCLWLAGAPEVLAVERPAGVAGKALLVFQHPGHADTAFQQLEGRQERDSMGRAQKVVRITSGHFRGRQLRVRKMGAHNGNLYGSQERATGRKRKSPPAGAVGP